jgi:hypothetical protein
MRSEGRVRRQEGWKERSDEDQGMKRIEDEERICKHEERRESIEHRPR